MSGDVVCNNATFEKRNVEMSNKIPDLKAYRFVGLFY